MKIGSNSVVSLEYSLHFGDGEVVDASQPGDPMVYLHGHSQIVPGLEAALEGLETGAKRQVVVSPSDGYGELNLEAFQRVPLSAFPEGFKPEVGMELVAEGPDGDPMPFVVKGVENSLEGQVVVVDFNHPLAGKTLHFEVTVGEIREATAEELEHGHVHGPEGHDHGHDHGHGH
ncbi:MAG: peptidylprolyl isomerase [Anaeromyxobacter sp.]|nr:peptidylprolyl isomerase [Anaeromyxobacter sp.]MBL0274639.1 peptidylprolyl isomerase [Anaeromyxobacter sp.]